VTDAEVKVLARIGIRISVAGQTAAEALRDHILEAGHSSTHILEAVIQLKVLGDAVTELVDLGELSLQVKH
jgi:hypothetical protein